MAEQRDVSNAYGLKLSCHTSNSLQLRKSSCPLCSNSRTRFVRIAQALPSGRRLLLCEGTTVRRLRPGRRDLAFVQPWGSFQSSEPVSAAARVESRITSSGFILCFEIFQSRFSSPALTPSITIFTARFPIASSGCRTVVNDGAASEDSGTSSKPTTEQCSGTFTPAFVSARIAPSAVKSSNAISAVNRFFLSSNSSVNRKPPSKPELGSKESGSCSTSAGSISIPDECANF